MSVTVQRNSSFLFRLLALAISGLFAPTPVFAAPPGSDTLQVSPNAGEHSSVDSSQTPDAKRDLSTQIRLPPALEAFLIAIIGTSRLRRPEAIPFYGARELSDGDRLERFLTIVRELVRIYSNPQQYPGSRKIQSLNEFIELTGPTRLLTGTGTLAGDVEELFGRLSTTQVAPAVVVPQTEENFSSSHVQVQAALYQYHQARHFLGILKGLQEGTSSPTVVGRIFQGVLGVLFTTRGAVHGLRELAEILSKQEAPVVDPRNSPPAATPTLPPPSLVSNSNVNQNGNRKNQNQNAKTPPALIQAPKPAQTPPKNQLAAVAGDALSVAAGGMLSFAALARAASISADAIETVHDLSESEASVLKVLKQLSLLPTQDQIKIWGELEAQINDQVIHQIYEIGAAAKASPEIQALANQDSRVYGLIDIFFEKYPKLLPNEIIGNMILDILRADTTPTDYQAMEMVIGRFGQMAMTFFQNILKISGMGSFGKIFEKLRDNTPPIPFEQIEKIIRADPNNYDLININPISVKSGKSFQIHYADLRNPDGTLTPVAIRILKPGMRELLDVERVIMNRLAPELAVKLKISERRVKALVDMYYKNLCREMDIPLTVHNQNEASKRLTKSVKIDIPPLGEQELRFFVPKAYPALAGSQVMVMERVTDIVPLADLERYYPDFGPQAAEGLYDLTMQAFLMDPLEASLNTPEKKAVEEPSPTAGPKSEPPTTGFMHADLHLGNLLFRKDFSAALIDFGLIEWIPPEQQTEIVKLTVGAAYNSYAFIEEALWNLRDAKAASKENATEVRRRLAEKVSKKLAYLKANKIYWGPDQWLEYTWIEEILDFPASLLSVKQGFTAMVNSYLRLALGEEGGDASTRENKLAQKGRELSERYKQLISRYAKKNLGRFRRGWGPVIWWETKHCIAHLLGRHQKDETYQP